MSISLTERHGARHGRRAEEPEPEVVDLATPVVRATVAEEERRRLSWALSADGPDGEPVVRTSLAILARYGWTALHRLTWPGADTPAHLAIGPGGVVVVEEQPWTGTIRVDGDVLRHNGYRCERELTVLAGGMEAVTALLPPEHRGTVSGVLCISARDLEPEPVAGVHVVGRLHLASHLASLPARLTPLEVADVTRALTRATAAGVAAEAAMGAALGTAAAVAAVPAAVPVAGPAAAPAAAVPAQPVAPAAQPTVPAPAAPQQAVPHQAAPAAAQPAAVVPQQTSPAAPAGLEVAWLPADLPGYSLPPAWSELDTPGATAPRTWDATGPGDGAAYFSARPAAEVPAPAGPAPAARWRAAAARTTIAVLVGLLTYQNSDAITAAVADWMGESATPAVVAAR